MTYFARSSKLQRDPNSSVLKILQNKSFVFKILQNRVAVSGLFRRLCTNWIGGRGTPCGSQFRTSSATRAARPTHVVRGPREGCSPTVMEGEAPPRSTFPTGAPLPLSRVLLDNERGCAWPDRTASARQFRIGSRGQLPCVAACQVGGSIRVLPYRQVACQPRWLATLEGET